MKDEKLIFEEFLKQKGLKLTAPRKIILQVFLKAEKHLSADELYELVKKEDRRIGYATVHRTLKLFFEAGLAREVDFGDGKKRFEHLFGHKHHDHLICVKCGKKIEFLDPEIEKLQNRVARRYGFLELGHRMEVIGACSKCR